MSTISHPKQPKAYDSLSCSMLASLIPEKKDIIQVYQELFKYKDVDSMMKECYNATLIGFLTHNKVKSYSDPNKNVKAFDRLIKKYKLQYCFRFVIDEINRDDINGVIDIYDSYSYLVPLFNVFYGCFVDKEDEEGTRDFLSCIYKNNLPILVPDYDFVDNQIELSEEESSSEEHKSFKRKLDIEISALHLAKTKSYYVDYNERDYKKNIVIGKMKNQKLWSLYLEMIECFKLMPIDYSFTEPYLWKTELSEHDNVYEVNSFACSYACPSELEMESMSYLVQEHLIYIESGENITDPTIGFSLSENSCCHDIEQLKTKLLNGKQCNKKIIALIGKIEREWKSNAEVISRAESWVNSLPA